MNRTLLVPRMCCHEEREKWGGGEEPQSLSRAANVLWASEERRCWNGKKGHSVLTRIFVLVISSGPHSPHNPVQSRDHNVYPSRSPRGTADGPAKPPEGSKSTNPKMDTVIDKYLERNKEKGQSVRVQRDTWLHILNVRGGLDERQTEEGKQQPAAL